ncbi:hypothetical protein [Ktedonospora formicarum]|uniref:Uncharacterized protein n=1 Tax=Ktedonospora formicarum TaxID=2778364 RepID=A0A8J3HTZ8_9CHLR|nr:hypothetical protein [Ktedonospora formicarum]GHO41941.1 hypothetical protein KSX_01040 [Ktedonospora formicarum]
MPKFEGSSTKVGMEVTDNDQLAELVEAAVHKAVDQFIREKLGHSTDAPTHLNTAVSIELKFDGAHAKNTYRVSLPVSDFSEAKRLLMEGDGSRPEHTVRNIVKKQRDWALTGAGKEGKETVSLTVSLQHA